MRHRSSVMVPLAIAACFLVAGPINGGVADAQGWAEEGVILTPDPNAPPPPEPDCECERRPPPWLDGACPALNPAVVRALFRDELLRVTRAWSTGVRHGALDDLLSDAAIRNTELAAAAIPRVAERWGLSEATVREAVGEARERTLIRLRDEGRLEPEAFRCLLQRLRLHVRPPTPGLGP